MNAQLLQSCPTLCDPMDHEGQAPRQAPLEKPIMYMYLYGKPTYLFIGAYLVAQMVKNIPAMQEDPCLISGSGRFPRRREWLPTLVFLPGEFCVYLFILYLNIYQLTYL